MGQTPQVCAVLRQNADEKCEHLTCIQWNRAEFRYDLQDIPPGDTGSTYHWEPVPSVSPCSHALPHYIPPIHPCAASSRPPEPPRCGGGQARVTEARHLLHSPGSEYAHQEQLAQRELSVETVGTLYKESMLRPGSPDQRCDSFPPGRGQEPSPRWSSRPLPPPPPQQFTPRRCPPPPPKPTPLEEFVGVGTGKHHFHKETLSHDECPDCRVCGRPEAVAFRGIVGEARHAVGIDTHRAVTDDAFEKLRNWTASTASSSKQGDCSATGSPSPKDPQEEAPLYEDPGEPLFGPWPPRLELPSKTSTSTAKFISPEPLMLGVSYLGHGVPLARQHPGSPSASCPPSQRTFKGSVGPCRSATSVSPVRRHP